MNLILFTIIFSLLCTYFLVPVVNRIGLHYKLLDYPNSRKKHLVPNVRIGGLAIFLSWLITILISFLINTDDVNIINANSKISFNELIICSFLFFMIGFSDDVKRLSPYIRLFFQFLVASITWGLGFSIDYLNLGFELIDLPVFASYIITTFLMVSLINAFNWWDGLDGLAAGTAIISTCFLILINFHFSANSEMYNTLILSSFLGTLLGFLIHNYKPARIHMGDGGSYFIGFLLSYFTLLNNFSIDTPGNKNVDQNYFPLLTIIVVLPLLIDMVRVIFLRINSFKLIFKPDRTHLHHKFLELGFTEKQTVSEIYAIVFMIGAFSLLFIDMDFSNYYFFIGSVGFSIFTFINLKK